MFFSQSGFKRYTGGKGGNSCCLWGVMSGNTRLLAFARRLELALPWCLPWRKTANEDEHGWVCSSSSAPASHVFTLEAQGWQRAHCGEELPPSNPEQGPTCKGLCAVLGGWKRLRGTEAQLEEAGRGQERAADKPTSLKSIDKWKHNVIRRQGWEWFNSQRSTPARASTNVESCPDLKEK